MEDLYVEIAQQLSDMGIDKENLSWSTRLTLVALILLISYIITKLFRHLVNERMMTSFCRMIPPIMFYLLLPFVFNNIPQVLDILLKGCLIYLVITTLMLVNSFLNSLYEISNEHETLRNRPLKGIYQMINLVAIGIGIILIISILIDQNAATILAGLGASAAVLMLIFKDSFRPTICCARETGLPCPSTEQTVMYWKFH